MSSETFEQAAKVYSLDGVDSVLLEKYKPVFIGRGGEHLVYDVPGHPNVVVKVSIDSIIDCAKWQMGTGATVDVYQEDVQVQKGISDRIEEAQDAYREIKDFFPEGALKQRYVRFRVPVSKALLHEIAKSKYNDLSEEQAERFPDELSVVALVQEKCKAFEEGKGISMFKEGYLVDDASFRDSLPEFLFPQRTDASSTNSDETPMQLSAVDSLRKDFFERALDYSNVTGRVLDIVGENNIVIHNSKDGTPTYTLIDAIYPAHWHKSLLEFQRFVSAWVLTDAPYLESDLKERASLVTNVADYIYKINKGAMTFGIRGEIDLFPDYSPEQKAKAIKIILKSIDVRQTKNA